MGTAAAYGGLFTASQGGIYNSQGSFLSTNVAASDFIWTRGGVATTNEAMRLGASILSIGVSGGVTGKLKFNQSTGSFGTLTIDATANGAGFEPTWTLPGNQGGAVVINPMSAIGDLIVGSTSGVPSRMAAGTPGQIMICNAPGVSPSWQPSPYMRYIGDWSGATVAAVNDVVWYGARNFVCIVANTGVVPTNATYWTQLGKGPGTRTTLTFGATVNWDVVATGNCPYLVLTGNCTMANPTNIMRGETYNLQINQGGAGGFSITWGSYFHWPNTKPPLLSTAAASIDVFSFLAVDIGYLVGVMQPGCN
jgi:hypothetical protein